MKQKQELKTKTGSLTIEDFQDIITAINEKQKKFKTLSSQWSKWATIKEKVRKKLDSMIKREEAKEVSGVKKEKENVRWKCLSCDEIHEKAEKILRCPNCKSENIKKISDYVES